MSKGEASTLWNTEIAQPNKDGSKTPCLYYSIPLKLGSAENQQRLLEEDDKLYAICGIHHYCRCLKLLRLDDFEIFKSLNTV